VPAGRQRCCRGRRDHEVSATRSALLDAGRRRPARPAGPTDSPDPTKRGVFPTVSRSTACACGA
ncbi:MAG TPA: hypothetical protein PKA21_12740, partial [Kiritimatiellia bacterium]|nr:hypothetical protein [Kiritimatiellia bacterium]